MANAPVLDLALARSGDTRQSGAAKPAASPEPLRDAEKSPARPRTDTVALVEQNASRPREVPTWLAVVAIVALSLVAGMTTYLVRLRTAAGNDPSTTTTASASFDRPYARVAKPRVPAP